jgi:HAD superfamily, subfamily IIIB (Acid phosphatase)
MAILLVLAAGAVAFAAQSQDRAVLYRAAGGGLFTSVRPTGVGLPQIGQSGTVGAGEIGPALRQYHDSGAYDRDLATVAHAAKSYLDVRLANAARACHRLSVRCRPNRRFAIVLDIDETSLSNYQGLVASNFSAAGIVAPAVSGTGTAIQPTLQLYRAARSRSVAVYFITGRPSAIQSITETNLRSVGYDQGWNAIYFKPSGTGTAAFKSSTRAGIQRQGYDIVVNLGDQESDLDGGHADRPVKLPNPFYFISD